jgi:hypothetical protein
MKPFVLAALIPLALSVPAFAKLEIVTIQACHGPFGPERQSWDVYPNEELGIRFTVTGARADKEGKTDGEITIRLTNAEGKALQDRTARTRKDLALGGDSFIIQGAMPIAPDLKPGEYTLSISYRDRLSGETASFDRKVRCLPPSFQILMPRFFRDPELKVPCSAGGFVGENLQLRLHVIGFDKSQKRVQTRMTCAIVDAGGEKVLATPVVTLAELNNPAQVADAKEVLFRGAIALNRAGDFRLRITVDDLVGKQTTTFETPLKVSHP